MTEERPAVPARTIDDRPEPFGSVSALRITEEIATTARPGSQILDGRRLSQARIRLKLSQSRFAEEINFAAHELGYPTRCSKRLVQKWEKGEHACPSLRYRSAIERVTGHSFESFTKSYVSSDYVPLSRRINEIAIVTAFLVRQLSDLANEMSFEELQVPRSTLESDETSLTSSARRRVEQGTRAS